MPVEGVRETLAALDGFSRELQSEARQRIAGMVRRTQQRARSLVPTGATPGPFKTHVRDQILTQVHQTEATGAVFVERRGIGGRFGTDNVGLWLEYGTAKQAPRPFMGPAAEPERAGFLREMDAAVDAAKQKAKL